jgi:3-oxoacyl-(acyl-carrier-protein) synthase
VAPLRDALARGEPIPTTDLARPGWNEPLRARAVPPPGARPSFLSHPRLRRTSPIAQQSVGAAIEALGEDAAKVADGSLRLGIILCAMSGCVNYSKRFYDEVLKDPGTASPLVFPETVFNAPASHLAALLGTTAINYTLVGDPGTFLQGIGLAGDWLLENRVKGCLVVGAEELDWLTTDAFRLFDDGVVLSGGAGALYLRREQGKNGAVQLEAVTESHLFTTRQSRRVAAWAARSEIRERADDGPLTPALSPSEGERESFMKKELLCDGLQGVARLDSAEQEAWRDWTGARLSPKRVLGEGLMAAAGWQCVAAVDALQRKVHRAAVVSVVGSNQQAIAARFVAGGLEEKNI